MDMNGRFSVCLYVHSFLLYVLHTRLMSLLSYGQDNEEIRHSDVVTWVSDGLWHIPHIEDMPLTVAIGNTLGWMVKPANFYTEDPSMDLHNAIAGDIKDPGTCAVIRTDLKL